jgi:hypothetical protein
MSNLAIFGIIVAGLVAGALLAAWLSKGDKLAKFLWLLIGATPGVSLLVEEPRFMFWMVIPAVLILFRSRQKKTNLVQ